MSSHVEVAATGHTYLCNWHYLQVNIADNLDRELKQVNKKLYKKTIGKMSKRTEEQQKSRKLMKAVTTATSHRARICKEAAPTADKR